MNVSLREPRPDDAAWLDTWLGACAASVGYEAIEPNAPARSVLDLLRRNALRAKIIVTAVDTGIVTYRPDAPIATIEFVGVDPAHTRRGHGHAGAALVEHELRTEGATAILAPAPAIHGISVYFWIRLGYRPLLRPAWPCEREGVAWLRRDLSAA